MRASLAMNAVNIAASAVLIGGVAFVPAFGVEGAAVANVVARVAGLAVACRLVLRHTDVRMRLAYLRPFPWKTLRRMLGVGIPSSGEQMNYDLAQIVILSFINVLGTTVVTVKVYCSMIAGIAYLYSIALSQATQIVLGYLFGAGKFDAVARRVWVADLTRRGADHLRVHAHLDQPPTRCSACSPPIRWCTSWVARCCLWRYSWVSGVRSTS